MTINPYELLKQKEIIKILIGDTLFGSIPCSDEVDEIFGFNIPKSVGVSMPNLTGREICDISTRFGFSMKYVGNQSSRRQYFEDMLDAIIQSGRCSDLLTFLFNKSQFVSKLSCFSPEIIDDKYNQIVNTVLEKINSILHCSGNELKIIDNKFIIQSSNTNIEIYAPNIKNIDSNYIANISKRALQEVESGHFDSALTKSRTLLEEIFLHVIEKKKKVPKNNGDIGELYKCVRNLYNMNIDKENDKRIKELLSGLAKIVSAIAEMRNANSDAHGLGTKRKFNIKDYHARLLVNSAMTLSDFILSVAENNLSSK